MNNMNNMNNLIYLEYDVINLCGGNMTKLKNDKLTMGQKIRLERVKSGYTQQELANYLSIVASLVSKWERDKFKPDINKLLILCKIFKKPLSYFLNEEYYTLPNEVELKYLSHYKDKELIFQANSKYVITETININQLGNIEDLPKDKKVIEENFFIFEVSEKFEDINTGDKLIVKQTKEKIKNGLYVVYDRQRLKLARNDKNFSFFDEKEGKKVIGLCVKMYRDLLKKCA